MIFPTRVGVGVQLAFFVASGVSRITFLGRAFEKLRQTRRFEPTHVGCHVFVARTACPLCSPGLVKANQNREAILSGRERPRAVSVAVPATPETDVPSIEIAFFVCYPVVWWINLHPT